MHNLPIVGADIWTNVIALVSALGVLCSSLATLLATMRNGRKLNQQGLEQAEAREDHAREIEEVKTLVKNGNGDSHSK